MRCKCVAYYARVQTNPPTTRSRNVELCEAGDRRRRPVPRLARRAARDLSEEHHGVWRALRRGDSGWRRDPAGLCRGVPDDAGSHGGELRLRAEAAQAAEELRREVAGRQHARREVTTSHARRGGGPSPPWVAAARFRGVTRLQ